MEITVFGGAGVIGSYAVKYLSEMNTFSRIVIADSNEKKAKEICKINNKIDFKKIDATDENSLKSVLKDVDIAINCIGPFYKYSPKILNSVINAGINYVDVCDDYDATEKLLDNYDKKAKNSGTTCIVGLGASPGLTNIIATFACRQLNSVDSIKIYVTRSIEEEAGGAIPYHMLHCWLGNIPIYKDGRFQKVRGLIDGEEYTTFPKPFGQSAVYYFGHPESITLPRYIKGVKNVCCKGSFFPPEFRDNLLQLQTLGLLSDNTININGKEIRPIDFTARFIEIIRKKIIKKSENIPSGGSVMVEVTGKDKDQTKTIRYSGISHMRHGTATPVAIGAQMIAEGNINKPGVNAPEGCIPPEEFVMSFLNIQGLGDAWLTITQKMEALS